MSKCLFVVDMQEIIVGKQHAKFFKYDTKLVEAVNQRISKYDSNNVIYIIQLMKRNFINSLLPFKAYKGTKEAEIAEEILRVNNTVVEKYKGDAFSNSELVNILKAKNVNEIEIVGVDGGGCVSLTAIGAIKAGYKVIVNTNAIGTMYEKNKREYFKKLMALGAEFI